MRAFGPRRAAIFHRFLLAGPGEEPQRGPNVMPRDLRASRRRRARAVTRRYKNPIKACFSVDGGRRDGNTRRLRPRIPGRLNHHQILCIFIIFYTCVLRRTHRGTVNFIYAMKCINAVAKGPGAAAREVNGEISCHLFFSPFYHFFLLKYFV